MKEITFKSNLNHFPGKAFYIWFSNHNDATKAAAYALIAPLMSMGLDFTIIPPDSSGGVRQDFDWVGIGFIDPEVGDITVNPELLHTVSFTHMTTIAAGLVGPNPQYVLVEHPDTIPFIPLSNDIVVFKTKGIGETDEYVYVATKHMPLAEVVLQSLMRYIDPTETKDPQTPNP